MSLETITYEEIDVPFQLQLPDGEWLMVQVFNIRLQVEEDELYQCIITFKVSPETYAQIDRQRLFHLEPEARGQLFGGSFDPAVEVEIEASLNRDLMPQLKNLGESTDEALNQLFELSAAQTPHPLLATDSWYGLYVKQELPLPSELQHLGTLKAGYRTIWAEEEG